MEQKYSLVHDDFESGFRRRSPGKPSDFASHESAGTGGHEPPKKVDGGYWGIVDEYQAGRFKVWIQDHARR